MPPAARRRPRSTTVEARIRRNNRPSADTVDSFRRVGGLLRPESEIRPAGPADCGACGNRPWCVSAHIPEVPESAVLKWDCREVSRSDGALNSAGLSRVRSPVRTKKVAECEHRRAPRAATTPASIPGSAPGRADTRRGDARVINAPLVIRVDRACRVMQDAAVAQKTSHLPTREQSLAKVRMLALTSFASRARSAATAGSAPVRIPAADAPAGRRTAAPVPPQRRKRP